MATESICIRLYGPLSWSQSAAPRLLRWTAPLLPVVSVLVAVVVPDWLTTNSTSSRFWRSWTCDTVVSDGACPLEPPLSVQDAEITPNTLPPWVTSDATVCRNPVQPWELCSAWP